ncbi:MAG: DNA polymerase III subunit delta' [Candidatus Aminicenantes bacterium]
MAFQDILGNNRAKKILSRALKMKRLPNSLLFSGPEGVGKKDVALVVAKALNCLNKRENSCEECSACTAINNRNFPDVMDISPENDVLKIEKMRVLKSTAYLRPMVGKKRVFIISESDRMRDEAANSLLKILEEPPSFSHIILLSHNPYLILPTIKSRCQILTFAPVFKEDIEKVLLEKGYDAEKARGLSLVVRGNLKQALSLDWEDVQEKRQKAWQILYSFLRREKIALHLRDFFSTRHLDKSEMEQVFEVLSSFCRDIILVKENGDRIFLMNPDYEQNIQEAADLLSYEQPLDFLEKMDYSLYALQKNLNVNLLTSSMFVHLMEKQHV